MEAVRRVAAAPAATTTVIQAADAAAAADHARSEFAGQYRRRQSAAEPGNAGRMSTILTTAATRGPSTIAGGSLGGNKSNPGAGSAAPTYTSTSL